MKRQTVLVTVLLGLMAVGVNAAEDAAQAETQAERADIRRLMEITGVGKLGVQAMNQLIGMFRESHTTVPDKFWEDFMAEVDPNELVEMCIPSYERHFTHEEIKQLIAFYETPLGKRLIEAQPLIMRECMVAGQQWGQRIGEKVAKKLKEDGY